MMFSKIIHTGYIKGGWEAVDVLLDRLGPEVLLKVESILPPSLLGEEPHEKVRAIKCL